MTIEKLEEFASNGDKHLTGLDVATGFPRADKPERPWFNKLFGDITGKINEIVDQVGDLPFVDGLLPTTKASYLNTAIGAVSRTLHEKLKDTVSVKDFGAKGDGVTDDTNSFRLAIAECVKLGRRLYVPNPSVEYLITSPLELEQFIQIEGESGALVSQYMGRLGGGTRIKYTGAGACFQVVPNPNPTTVSRLGFGVKISKIIIQGTEAGAAGIKVSDVANINVAGMDLAGFQCEDVFIYDFKSGRGLDINFCFNNKITNLVVETCGIVCSLNYAHNTTFIGGSAEQSLMGFDIVSSYDVSLHGTITQGLNSARAALQGLSMPSNTHIWADGWTGTGATGVIRTVPADYKGIGIRNFGSIVSVFGGYEESNDIGLLMELDSHTSVFGRYVDLDAGGGLFASTKQWVQIGIGGLTAKGVKFVQGSHEDFVGVFHTERNFAAPLDVSGCTFSNTIPVNKRYTGIVDAVGVYDDYRESLFKNIRTMKNVVVDMKSSYQREFVETVPTSTGDSVVDFSVGTTGVNILHGTSGTSLYIEFLDPNRRKDGIPLRVAINNLGSASIPITFKDNSFRVANNSALLPKGHMKVFTFIYMNGLFIEEGVDITL